MNYKQICAEIMQSKGEKRLAIIPLPKSWLDHLQFNGIQINYSKSYIALLKYSFFCFLKGFYRAFILFYNRSKKNKVDNSYAVFLDMSINNIPKISSKDRYDIISWYQNAKIRDRSIKEYWLQISGPCKEKL